MKAFYCLKTVRFKYFRSTSPIRWYIFPKYCVNAPPFSAAAIIFFKLLLSVKILTPHTVALCLYSGFRYIPRLFAFIRNFATYCGTSLPFNFIISEQGQKYTLIMRLFNLQKNCCGKLRKVSTLLQNFHTLLTVELQFFVDLNAEIC